MNFSKTHVLLIPSYNTGEKLFETVAAARAQWAPVWVVMDGSTDGTTERLQAIAAGASDLRVLTLPENRGKGSAVLHGTKTAEAEGFTHVLTMDADGQHPAWLIPDFMRTSAEKPDALVLGKPVFDSTVPKERLHGRKIANFWTHVETLWAGIGDCLYGFRVYPIAPLRKIMENRRWMRRFDFDPEAAVRLVWAGHPPVNIDAPVKYFRREEGGVSHFNYLRDNVLLTGMYCRLLAGFLKRLPRLLWRKLAR